MSGPERRRSSLLNSVVLVLIIFSFRCTSGASIDGTVPADTNPPPEVLGVMRIFGDELLPWFSLRDLLSSNATDHHVWPKLKFNWRIVLGTIIGFLGASLGSVGGVGGGGIFVPMLTLIVGFDQKTSAALSKCMIMGACVSSVWFVFGLKHPARNVPIIDYSLALIFQPMLMLGISLGVIFNVIFPNWLVTILLIILFTVTSIKAFSKAISTYKCETIQKKLDKTKNLTKMPSGEGLEIGSYEPLQDNTSENQGSVRIKHNWKGILYLIFVWICFLILQILKNYTTKCSGLYWLYNSLQIPVALFVFLKEAVRLHNRSKALELEQHDFLCSADIQWTFKHLILSALAGIGAGVVGGLLGLGGGFIIGPLLLELNVPPEVSSATATFIMLFSSSMSVIQYHLLHRFPVPFALYLIAVSVLAGIGGQYVVKKIVSLLGRASIIIFILAIVIMISAFSLGGFGIQASIVRLERKEYMGFFSLCN